MKHLSLFQVPPRETKKVITPLPKLQRKYQNDHKMIEQINSAQTSWRAKAYPENEK